MNRSLMLTALLATTALAGAHYACAGQAPAAASDPDIPISHQPRLLRRTVLEHVSVTDPVDNKLLGAIHLGAISAIFSQAFIGLTFKNACGQA